MVVNIIFAVMIFLISFFPCLIFISNQCMLLSFYILHPPSDFVDSSKSPLNAFDKIAAKHTLLRFCPPATFITNVHAFELDKFYHFQILLTHYIRL